MQIVAFKDPNAGARERTLGEALEGADKVLASIRVWVHRIGKRSYQDKRTERLVGLAKRYPDAFRAAVNRREGETDEQAAARLQEGGFEITAEHVQEIAEGGYSMDTPENVAAELVTRIAGLPVIGEDGKPAAYDSKDDPESLAGVLADLFTEHPITFQAVLYLAEEQEREYQEAAGRVKARPSPSRMRQRAGLTSEGDDNSTAAN